MPSKILARTRNRAQCNLFLHILLLCGCNTLLILEKHRNGEHREKIQSESAIIYGKSGLRGAIMAVAPAPAYDEVYEFLLSAPTPQQVIEFRPSQQLQEHIRELLEANDEGILAPDQRAEL